MDCNVLLEFIFGVAGQPTICEVECKRFTGLQRECLSVTPGIIVNSSILLHWKPLQYGPSEAVMEVHMVKVLLAC